MQLSLVAVGKLRPALRDLCDDYLRRLGRFVKVDESEVREAGRAGSEQLQRDTEGKHLLDAVAAGSPLVLLDMGGTMWSSEQLAAQLDAWRLDARERTLVVGGAAGVSAALRARAATTWSLGPLTLPHEIARLVVVEQLYRASTILRGEPYHKGAR
jgi:23S rRNA (pseudouridine1915-N3)-methyltransferase